jgi:4,5-dihydroxyphthalate decarboxylase
MSKLTLSVAVGDYDRTRPLSEGAVQIDGVAPVIMNLSPEEIFFRAFRNAEFDICELSLSSFTVKTAARDCAYVGVPAFLSRAFRHTSIYVRTDRIREPADLRGKTVGVPEYQLTANVWARALLQDEFGVAPSQINSPILAGSAQRRKTPLLASSLAQNSTFSMKSLYGVLLTR